VGLVSVFFKFSNGCRGGDDIRKDNFIKRNF